MDSLRRNHCMASTLARFNLLDFYLWGHLKFLVYAALVDKKRHFTTKLLMSVRLSATTSAYLNGCGGP
jgi:hypothetical protein